MINTEAPRDSPSSFSNFTAERPLKRRPLQFLQQIQLQKSVTEHSPHRCSTDKELNPSPGANATTDKENVHTNKRAAGSALFVPGKVLLKDLKRSDSSKWMRPRGQTPEKKDMKSHLEKSLGNMR